MQAYYDEASSKRFLARTDLFAEALAKRLKEEGVEMQISPAVDGFNFHICGETYTLLNNGLEAVWQRTA